MAFSPHISTAAASAACNGIVDLLDAAAGSIKIFDGTMPTECSVADAGTVCSTITLPYPAWGAASNGVAAFLSGPWTDSAADATGTAQYFRVYTNGGTCTMQGTVGTAGCDMNLNSTAIQINASVSITAFGVTVPINPD